MPAASGAFFNPGNWYRRLDKPGWTPPDGLFPIIWTILYILMSLAAVRVTGLPGNDLALGLWALHIALGTLWSAVFFGANRIRAALVVIVALLASVAATTISFYLLDPIAGLLMLPYALWGSFATALNADIVRRNPTLA